jgi:hypothetical protein
MQSELEALRVEAVRARARVRELEERLEHANEYTQVREGRGGRGEGRGGWRRRGEGRKERGGEGSKIEEENLMLSWRCRDFAGRGEDIQVREAGAGRRN